MLICVGKIGTDASSFSYRINTTRTIIITGPPTHSVGGQYRFTRWSLSSSVVVCNTP